MRTFHARITRPGNGSIRFLWAQFYLHEAALSWAVWSARWIALVILQGFSGIWPQMGLMQKPRTDTGRRDPVEEELFNGNKVPNVCT